MVAPEYPFERRRDLTYRCLGAGGCDGEAEQVLTSLGACLEIGERLLYAGRVAFCLEALQLGYLPGAHDSILDFQHVDRPIVDRPVLIDTDDGLAAAVDARLGLGCGLLDA